MSRQVVNTDKWWIYYADGSRSLDLESSQSAYTLGFSNHEIVDAMADQLKSVSRILPFWEESHPAIDKCADHIKSTGGWDYLYWSTSGTSAVECALMIVEEYWNAVGENNRTKVVSYTPGWHGTTYLTRGLNNRQQHIWNSEHTVNVVTPMWLDEKDRAQEEERALRETVQLFEQGDVAAVIFNPVAWFNGIMPFSQNFWKMLRQICDMYDVLMVVDDVTACWGKVGTWHSYTGIGGGVKPDISAMGKAMTGGHAPFGVTATTNKILQTIWNTGRGVNYGHAWCPSMGAIAAVNKTTEIIERDNLLARSHVIEQTNIEMCKRFGDQIKSFRTAGCFCAIDLHNDIDQTKYLHKGLSTKHRKNVIKITTPLIADEEYFFELEKRLREIL
jgi:adenosylmethionine-8-amino-7-oxononanoate aminotransferase